MKYHAFISYSRKDFDEVNTFIQKIKAEVPEFEYWFDLDGIESGDEFIRKIVSAIDNSERLFFMVSDDSINSKWAEQEVMYARNSDKRIIPILLKGAKLKGWFLFTFGNIDTIDTQDSRQVAKLISNLCRWCGSKEEKPQSSPKADATPTISKATPTQTAPSKEEVEIPKVIKIEGKYGFQFKNGKIAIPCIYDYAEPFSEGLSKVKKDNKCGFIDLNGNMVIPYIYDSTYSFSEGRAVVKKGGKYGHIDLNGKMIVPYIYDDAGSFSEGRARVQKEGEWGYINLDGNLVIPCIYDSVWSFSEGRARVEKDDKYGYIDLNGNLVIPCIYDKAESFSERRAEVQKEGKWGYIDLDGNLVIPYIYDYAGSFSKISKGRARVKKDGNYYYIDLNGNEIK